MLDALGAGMLLGVWPIFIPILHLGPTKSLWESRFLWITSVHGNVDCLGSPRDFYLRLSIQWK